MTRYIPFFIREPTSGEYLPGAVGGDHAQISKVWSGLKKECCSDADNFQVVFPTSAGACTRTRTCTGAHMQFIHTSSFVLPTTADIVDRANLLGATVLLDFSYFETRK